MEIKKNQQKEVKPSKIIYCMDARNDNYVAKD
jgi:hypothetical protein